MSKGKLLNDLGAAGDDKILEALKLAGDVGNDKLIPVVISLALTNKNEEIVRAAKELIRSIKSKALLPELIEAIKTAKKNSDKQELTSLCWESGQNCDPHFRFFVDLALKEPFEVALEAITVIEEMSGNFELKDLQDAISDVEKAIAEQPEKATLLATLVVSLKGFLTPENLN
jgi:hypothetical protein